MRLYLDLFAPSSFLSLLACYLDIVKGEAACSYSCCFALALSLTPEPSFSMLEML